MEARTRVVVVLALWSIVASTRSAHGAIYVFSGPRTAYVLDLTPNGVQVRDAAGNGTSVPYGEKITFNNEAKYAKNTVDVLHHVTSHLEVYVAWAQSVDLPVEFLRTSPRWSFIGAPTTWGPDQLSGRAPILPDRADKVIVAYVNAVEFSAVGKWDPSFDPAWDRNDDAIIDSTATGLPPYVDVRVFNAPWKSYVAAYWTESWRQQLARKIDIAAAEHFDGVMLDVMTGYWTWKAAYPAMDVDRLRADSADLFRWASRYAKQRYGTAFVVTANLDPAAYQYFSDLGRYIDAGYDQNAFFEWNGSGQVNGYGRSVLSDRFSNPAIQFISAQGLSVLDMDHLGTGPVSPGLEFPLYDDRITPADLQLLLKWAIASGSTPYCAPVFFDSPYRMVPRFVRMLPGRPVTTNTRYADWVIGSGGDDNIETGDGDDLIYGGPGNDHIDGGTGANTAFYLGARAGFDISVAGGALIVSDLSGAEGTDRLTNIQFLQFGDRLFRVGLASAPVGLSASSSGSAATLTWTAPATGGSPDTYIIEAGSSPGSADLANFSTGTTATTFSTTGVAAGTYYVRVRAGNASGSSTPSNEAVLTVAGSGGCSAAPGSPSNLTAASSQSGTVVLSWTAASGNPTSYVVEAGSRTGAVDLANTDLGSPATSLTATGVSRGTYYVRMRGKNACGLGTTSNEFVVTVF